MPNEAGMLSPYRVLDLTSERAYLCGKIFADLGADVIKVEKPGGDAGRMIPPFYRDVADPERSLYWWGYNSGKRGVTLDIEKAEGAELFERLVAESDIVIESFDPGYLKGLGLDYGRLSEINPSIIVTSISGFGQTGPYSGYKACDLVLWALSGNQYIYGDSDRPPLSPSFPISYSFAALQGAIGTMVALFQRRSTGKGQQVDVSAHMALFWATGPEYQGLWEFEKILLRRSGPHWLNALSGISIRVIYPCADGAVTFFPFFGPLRVGSNRKLAEWMESEGVDSRGFGDTDSYAKDWGSLDADRIGRWTDGFAEFFGTRAKKELLEGAAKRDIILYPIFTPKDIIDFPQLESREFWARAEHPGIDGTVAYPGAFFRTDGPPCRTGQRPPLVGEHNAELYSGELGLDDEALAELEKAGVI